MLILLSLIFTHISLIFQGAIVYESVGLYPAQSFFQVNATTGVINIIQSLKQDVFSRTEYTVSSQKSTIKIIHPVPGTCICVH